LIAGADLVLTATRQHRADVVEHVPAAVRRTFTLREFARLAAAVDPAEIDDAAGPGARPAERLAALVPLAARERVQVPAELDDVVDPYRRSDEVYQESFEQLIEAVRVVARVVLGVGAPA
jgi:protein-tyrosine phosphatase